MPFILRGEIIISSSVSHRLYRLPKGEGRIDRQRVKSGWKVRVMGETLVGEWGGVESDSL